LACQNLFPNVLTLKIKHNNQPLPKMIPFVTAHVDALQS